MAFQFSIILALILSVSLGWGNTNLQNLIDQTPEGQVVPLKPGVYKGQFVINKSVVLDGLNQSVTLDGEGTGSVLIIKANNVTIKNLKIINSGNIHDTVDAGIAVRSSKNLIEGNRIADTLFGIDLKEAHKNKIIGNEISSKDVELGVRGDGIRAWASNGNIFQKNNLHDTRDMVIWYSYDNIIEDNTVRNSRYSLHFMYTGKTEVRRNSYRNNAVGIFLMYSQGSVIENNEVLFSYGGTGMGIGMKEVDHMTIRKNRVVYCTTGIYIDQSPYRPSAYNLIVGNEIAFNHEGIVLHSELKNNIFKGNSITDNLEDVLVHANGTAQKNIWSGNYWGSYEGFDRNNDEIGDREFKLLLYQDKLLTTDPWVKFFYASPVLTVINFLSRLAPFSEPVHLLTDKNPIFKRSSPVRLSEKNMALNKAELFFDLDAEDEEDEYENGEAYDDERRMRIPSEEALDK